MLNFFTTSNGFRSTLPVVSNLTAMNIWDGVCMCFIYASLLEFVCVNYVGRKRPLHNVVYRPGENPVTQVILLLNHHVSFIKINSTFFTFNSLIMIINLINLLFVLKFFSVILSSLFGIFCCFTLTHTHTHTRLLICDNTHTHTQ